MAKLLLPPVLALGIATTAFLPSTSSGDTTTTTATDPVTVTVTVHDLIDGQPAAWWARRARSNGRKMRARARTVRQLRHRWAPTVTYALRLASSVYGVPERELRAVSYCESTWNPYATNGRYHGLFQLGWTPFARFSPFDPVANALSAAATVSHDGGWRQWQCKP